MSPPLNVAASIAGISSCVFQVLPFVRKSAPKNPSKLIKLLEKELATMLQHLEVYGGILKPQDFQLFFADYTNLDSRFLLYVDEIDSKDGSYWKNAKGWRKAWAGLGTLLDKTEKVNKELTRASNVARREKLKATRTVPESSPTDEEVPEYPPASVSRQRLNRDPFQDPNATGSNV